MQCEVKFIKSKSPPSPPQKKFNHHQQISFLLNLPPQKMNILECFGNDATVNIGREIQSLPYA